MVEKFVKEHLEELEESDNHRTKNGAKNACSECGSMNLIHDYEKRELVCDDCGLVEPIMAAREVEGAGHGPPPTFMSVDKGLGSQIDGTDWCSTDARGKRLWYPKKKRYLYLQRKDRATKIGSAEERNLAFALSELDRIASALGLKEDVKETAAWTYRRAVECGLLRGRSIEGVVGGVLYSACRQNNVPRTLDEIAAVSRVSRKEIGRLYRFVSRELDLKLIPTSPLDYIPRFCEGLGLPKDVQLKASEIIREAEEKELAKGRGPTGIAAAAIYIASIVHGEHRTQREIADMAAVTEVTVRNRYKELSEELGYDIGL